MGVESVPRSLHVGTSVALSIVPKKQEQWKGSLIH